METEATQTEAKDLRETQSRFNWSAQLFLGNKKSTFGFAILFAMVFFGIFAPYLAPYDPSSQNLANTFQPPFWISGGSLAHFFGTDNLGRDILSRFIYGFRIADYIAFTVTIFVALIGTAIGLVSGYYRGIIDGIVQRIVDMWMAFPPVLLSLALILILGSVLNNVILAIVLVDWTRFTRVIRGEVFNVREKDYILAAKSVGFSGFHIITKEVLPNIVPLIIVLASLEMGIAITVEVLLSFVGLGIPPSASSWGAMIASGLPYLQIDPWPTLLPLAAVILSIVGLNLLGDGIREQTDPMLQVTR